MGERKRSQQFEHGMINIFAKYGIISFGSFSFSPTSYEHQFYDIMSGFTRLIMYIKYVFHGPISPHANFVVGRLVGIVILLVKNCRWGEREKILSFRGQIVHFKWVPQEGENRSAVHFATLLVFFDLLCCFGFREQFTKNYFAQNCSNAGKFEESATKLAKFCYIRTLRNLRLN